MIKNFVLVSDRVIDFLDRKAEQYNGKWFIEKDPVSIPHLFSKKEDIEIGGFLVATIAWGRRSMILQKARLLMEWMDMSPHEFVMKAGDKELSRLSGFVYRTFNGADCQYFVSALREIYLNNGGLEQVITDGYREGGSVYTALDKFRQVFMQYRPLERTGKHFANVTTGSSAKRLNMYLRWMVRDDGIVDFGIWKGINKSDLMIPLDVHVGRIGRQLGLLERKQDDWKAVEELTQQLRLLRPEDPVYYDYALFGTGVFESEVDFGLLKAKGHP